MHSTTELANEIRKRNHFLNIFLVYMHMFFIKYNGTQHNIQYIYM